MPDEIYESLDAETLAQKFDSNNDLDTGNLPVIIKAIGVGGGGGNAVGHMYKQGIQDVKFVVLNTDRQALLASPVPEKVMIGAGRGVGGKPEKGAEVAESSIEKIRALLTTAHAWCSSPPEWVAVQAQVQHRSWHVRRRQKGSLQ